MASLARCYATSNNRLCNDPNIAYATLENWLHNTFIDVIFSHCITFCLIENDVVLFLKSKPIRFIGAFKLMRLSRKTKLFALKN